MNSKTPAEMQMELLKKMKAQQLAGAPAKPPKSGAQAPRPSSALSLAQDKKSRGAKGAKRQVGAIRPSAAGWRRLKAEGLASGRLKMGANLGDWMIELVLNIPPELAHATGEAKEEIYAKIRDWCKARGLG